MNRHRDTPVDDLICDLGAIRVAADTVQADMFARRAIDDAITQAVRATGAAIMNPNNPEAVSTAQQTVQRSAQLILALQSESARSQRLASTAARLRQTARRRQEKP